MGADTKIQWCHFTFNPWIGCDKVSAGCKNCYAEVETYSRVSKARGLPLWGPKAARHRTKTWGDPKRWNRKAREARRAAEAKGEPYERPRVFCASLCDVFEGRADLDPWRAELWPLIEQCDEIDWMLLTKRPQNIMEMVPESWRTAWPKHAWIGTSVEDQERADERIPHLLRVPARVRFLSMEPLLGPVDVRAYSPHTFPDDDDWNSSTAANFHRSFGYSPDQGIHLVIVGGEGHGGRPCDIAWVRSIVKQCAESGVACFVKQIGANPVLVVDGIRGPYVGTADKKGGDPAEWPPDLRVREMPEVKP